MEKNKQVDLTEEEQEVLRKHHEAKRKALLAELSRTDSKLELYGGKPRKNTQPSLFKTSFPKTDSLPAKVLFIINEFEKFVTIQDIVKKFSEHDPSILDNGKVIRQKYAHIYGAVLAKLKTGEIVRTVIPGSDLFEYGLREWLDENGNQKDDYKS